MTVFFIVFYLMQFILRDSSFSRRSSDASQHFLMSDWIFLSSSSLLSSHWAAVSNDVINWSVSAVSVNHAVSVTIQSTDILWHAFISFKCCWVKTKSSMSRIVFLNFMHHSDMHHNAVTSQSLKILNDFNWLHCINIIVSAIKPDSWDLNDDFSKIWIITMLFIIFWIDFSTVADDSVILVFFLALWGL